MHNGPGTNGWSDDLKTYCLHSRYSREGKKQHVMPTCQRHCNSCKTCLSIQCAIRQCKQTTTHANRPLESALAPTSSSDIIRNCRPRQILERFKRRSTFADKLSNSFLQQLSFFIRPRFMCN